MARWIGQYQYTYTERELQPGEWYMPEDIQTEYVPTEVTASNYWDAARKSEKQANARKVFGEEEHPRQNYLISERDVKKAERSKARGEEDPGGMSWRWFFDDERGPWASTMRSHYARDQKEQAKLKRHREQQKAQREQWRRGPGASMPIESPDLEKAGRVRKKDHWYWGR